MYTGPLYEEEMSFTDDYEERIEADVLTPYRESPYKALVPVAKPGPNLTKVESLFLQETAKGNFLGYALLIWQSLLPLALILLKISLVLGALIGLGLVNFRLISAILEWSQTDRIALAICSIVPEVIGIAFYLKELKDSRDRAIYRAKSKIDRFTGR